jgi:hypothetical protein
MSAGFTPCTAVSAEGARVALFTCEVCGATVMHDSRDEENRLEQHLAWHEALSDSIKRNRPHPGLGFAG